MISTNSPARSGPDGFALTCVTLSEPGPTPATFPSSTTVTGKPGMPLRAASFRTMFIVIFAWTGAVDAGENVTGIDIGGLYGAPATA